MNGINKWKDICGIMELKALMCVCVGKKNLQWNVIERKKIQPV